MPVMNFGFSRGFTLGSMVGFNNAAAGDGTGFLLSATAGFRRIALSGFVSGLSGSAPGAKTLVAKGGTLAVKLAGGPLVPVGITLLTGAGYYAPGSGPTTWRVPVGLGISWTIPQPVVALKLWASPRLDYARVRGPVRTTTGTDFGLSGGVNLGFLNGLSLDVAVDRRFSSGPGAKPTSFGLGASYHFK